MGFKRVFFSGLVGMIIFIPMAFISFSVLDLVGEITGGLIQNLNSLGGLIPADYQWVWFIGGAVAGTFLLNIYPIHYALIYDSNDISLLLAVILPWILTGVIIAALFAHSPKGGFNSMFAVGIGFFIISAIIYAVASIVGGSLEIPINIGAVLDDLSDGMTGLPFLGAAAAASFEGAAIGGIFGALIGSLKYKGEGQSGSKKSKSKGKSKSKSKKKEPSFSSRGGSSSSSASGSSHCKNCGAKLVPGDDFCINCGSKA